jgi:hypothetical protein
MAVPEGGFGGQLGMMEQLDVRMAASNFDSVEGINLVLRGR